MADGLSGGGFGGGLALGGRQTFDMGKSYIEGEKYKAAREAKAAKALSDEEKALMKDMDVKGIHPILSKDAEEMGAKYVGLIQDTIKKGEPLHSIKPQLSQILRENEKLKSLSKLYYDRDKISKTNLTDESKKTYEFMDRMYGKGSKAFVEEAEKEGLLDKGFGGITLEGGIVLKERPKQKSLDVITKDEQGRHSYTLGYALGGVAGSDRIVNQLKDIPDTPEQVKAVEDQIRKAGGNIQPNTILTKDQIAENLWMNSENQDSYAYDNRNSGLSLSQLKDKFKNEVKQYLGPTMKTELRRIPVGRGGGKGEFAVREDMIQPEMSITRKPENGQVKEETIKYSAAIPIKGSTQIPVNANVYDEDTGNPLKGEGQRVMQVGRIGSKYVNGKWTPYAWGKAINIKEVEKSGNDSNAILSILAKKEGLDVETALNQEGITVQKKWFENVSVPLNYVSGLLESNKIPTGWVSKYAEKANKEEEANSQKSKAETKKSVPSETKTAKTKSELGSLIKGIK